MKVFGPLLQRLRTATARERAGLALLGLLIALSATAWAFDWDMRARESFAESNAQLAEAQSNNLRITNAAYQEAMGLGANKVWRWSLVQSSEGVARAQAVAVVEGMASEAGLSGASVELGASAVGEGDAAVTAIPLEVSAGFDWVSYLRFLREMSDADLSLTVDSIDVDEADSSGFTMALRAPYLHETIEP